MLVVFAEVGWLVSWALLPPGHAGWWGPCCSVCWMLPRVPSQARLVAGFGMPGSALKAHSDAKH